MVREMDLVPDDRVDNRRLEVVADGLPLFGGAQLAIDTTLVSASNMMARHDLKLTALTEWHWLLQDGTRQELTLNFLEAMAEPASWSSLRRWEGVGPKKLASFWLPRSAPVLLQPSVRAAWLHRWRGLLACAAALSFAEFLLGNTALGWMELFHPSRMCCVISATCCELWS